MNAIEISHLSKRYGSSVAVDDLSLQIPSGTVFGLLGPNGAGKTTTFRCMLGLMRANAGSVEYSGRPLAPSTFEDIAYVPERSVLYEWMTVAQHVELNRRAFARFDPSVAAQLLTRFSIDPRKRVRALSKGMRTAVMVSLAFARNAKVLILDEPTSGLDPVNQRHVLGLIVNEAARGNTVLFSSHQIGQVERAADRIAVLDRGRAILTGQVDDLKADRKIVEGVFLDGATDISAVSTDPRVARVDRVDRIVRLLVTSGADDVAQRMTAAGATGVRLLDLNLEDIFFYAVSPADATSDAATRSIAQ
jgi:ABC-2 type transport system ATP-binding protein